MGTYSLRTGVEETGLHLVESVSAPLHGWTLRPNPDDKDDSFDPEELEAELEGGSFAADELVHVEEPLADIDLDDDFYPEDTGEYEWATLEE